MKGEVMSEAIGVVEQQIAAYRRANPSARALTDTQILSIMTQSGEIKKAEDADKGLAVERTITPVQPTAVTPQQQRETSAEVQPMTKKEAEDTAIETIASNSAQALRTINNIDGGKISTTYNEIKEALHSELAESNVARVAYAQNESAELLRKAQNNELTYEEYCKRKKGVLLETFPLPNMTDKQKASVAKMVASLSPKETEEFLKKSLALPNPKAKNYKSKVNEFLNDFKMSTTEMISNAQNGDKTGTLKSTTKTKTAYKLSGGKRLMTFDETYKSEMGVTFKKENIEAYNRSAATFAGVSKMTEKMDEIHKQLDNNITIVEGNNRNGVDSQTLETCNKRLEIGLKNSLRNLYGDDETAISKGLKDLTGENYSYKNGKLTMDVPANSGFAYTVNGNDLVRLSKKVLKTVDENYSKIMGNLTVEDYANDMATANKVAYGMKNASQLADAYRADQEGVVHTVRAGVEYAGTAVMVAGMLCYPPVAFAGGAIASFGGVGVEMTEEATKQHTDPETMKALGEELATNAALMVVGMKAGQTGVAVKNALLAKNSPKLMATIADIGTDASISLMGDLALTGQVNLEGEGFSQVMSLIAGHRGKIVGGVKKIKEALKTPKAELEAPQPKAEVKPETEIPQPKAAEQALRDEIARQKALGRQNIDLSKFDYENHLMMSDAEMAKVKAENEAKQTSSSKADAPKEDIVKPEIEIVETKTTTAQADEILKSECGFTDAGIAEMRTKFGDAVNDVAGIIPLAKNIDAFEFEGMTKKEWMEIFEYQLENENCNCSLLNEKNIQTIAREMNIDEREATKLLGFVAQNARENRAVSETLTVVKKVHELTGEVPSEIYDRQISCLHPDDTLKLTDDRLQAAKAIADATGTNLDLNAAVKIKDPSKITPEFVEEFRNNLSKVKELDERYDYLYGVDNQGKDIFEINQSIKNILENSEKMKLSDEELSRLNLDKSMLYGENAKANIEYIKSLSQDAKAYNVISISYVVNNGMVTDAKALSEITNIIAKHPNQMDLSNLMSNLRAHDVTDLQGVADLMKAFDEHHLPITSNKFFIDNATNSKKVISTIEELFNNPDLYAHLDGLQRTKSLSNAINFLNKDNLELVKELAKDRNVQKEPYALAIIIQKAQTPEMSTFVKELFNDRELSLLNRVDLVRVLEEPVQIEFYRDVLKGADIPFEGKCGIVKRVNSDNVSLAKDLLNNNQFIPIEKQYILSSTTEANIEFARELVQNKNIKEPWRIIDATRADNIDFAREIVKNDKIPEEYKAGIIEATTAKNMDFAREVLNNSEIDVSKKEIILAHTNETNIDFARDMLKNKRLTPENINDILRFTQPNKLDFAKEIVKNEKIDPADMPKIILGVNDGNKNFAKKLINCENVTPEQMKNLLLNYEKGTDEIALQKINEGMLNEHPELVEYPADTWDNIVKRDLLKGEGSFVNKARVKEYARAKNDNIVETHAELQQSALKNKDLLKTGLDDITDSDILQVMESTEAIRTIDTIGLGNTEAAFPLMIDEFETFTRDIANLNQKLSPENSEMLAQKLTPEFSQKFSDLNDEITSLKKQMNAAVGKENLAKIKEIQSQRAKIDEQIKQLKQNENATSPEIKEQIKNLQKQSKVLGGQAQAIYYQGENAKQVQALMKEISTKTKELKNFVQEKTNLSPQDVVAKTRVLAAMATDSPQEEIAQFISMIKPSSPEADLAWNTAVNRKIFQDLKVEYDDVLAEKLDLVNCKYLGQMYVSSDAFFSNMRKLVTTIKENPNLTVEEALDNLPQNIETKLQYKELGIDYDKWTKVDKNSYTSVELKLNAEEAKQKAIHNLEEDLNDDLFKRIPDEVKEPIFERLQKEFGITFEKSQKDNWVGDGFDAGSKEYYRLMKDGKPIQFEDMNNIVSTIKEEILKNDFWTKKQYDQGIEEARGTMYTHLIKMRTQEVDNARTLKDGETANIEVRKTDMYDIKKAIGLGNDAQCCTALGRNFNEWSAPTYITNKCIGAIELTDKGAFVGNTMTYIAYVDGKPALVLDNIELKTKYQDNDKIRDTFIEYAKKLCEEIGQPDLPIYAGPNRHKLDMSIYPKSEHSMEPIGSSGDEYVYIDYDASRHKIGKDGATRIKMYKIR